ncbi:sphingosine n-acyltransferase lag1 [Fusarium tjaetaba]|uniref:Sphingosine n-acyltransferase lag1 n=1 Tax=Fusarium tjaetaba TaxID=1567544 RepID=A0A8H5VCD7_9HYPO|nr:sphingosine n-acyltransferase lag1 [Fusarium tjaetaba]KAF5619292.1 sphingosine n-acyltransferase lag1 [Fusarium tjaetaba]
MKAIQIKEFNAPYTISDVDKPKPKPHQLLIQIKAGGFCHTDCMALENSFGSELPFFKSHKSAGVVAEVGSEVQGFAEGDRVGCLNFDSCCGKCPDCKASTPIYCDNPLMKGITTDGAWAEYMAADARFTVKLPDSLDFPTAACMMCAGITVYGGIKKAQVPYGGSIGIVGIGGLGPIGTQVAEAMGYQVAAIDVKQDALDLVASYALKPDICILSTDTAETSMEKITNVIKGDYPSLDATIIATDAPAAFDFAAKLTRKHGTIVLLGQPDKGITLSYQNAIFHDIKLIGSLVAETDETEELLELVVEHNIQVKIKEWKLEDAEKMRQEYLTGKVAMAAKLRSKRCQEQTSVKQWLIDNQLGICLGILTPLLIAQCNSLTRLLTAKLTSLSYRDEFTGEYGVGFDDNYLVAVLIVVLTGLRDATMRFVLDPVAAAWGLGRARSMRFKEQAWMVIYYATCWSVGMCIYASSSYWMDLQAMWTNWPNREISGLMKIYMLAQLAFWLQQMIVINIEKRRKDHWQMLSHHVVTIALVYCSYRYGLTRVGNVVLILMDFNDLIFSTAKCLKYMKLQSLCDFMFGAFVVSWVLCRHVAFPMVCWSVYAHSLAIAGPKCFAGSGNNIIGPSAVPAHGYFYLFEPLIYTNGRVCYDYTIKTLFVSGLLFLEALMLVWFVMIVKLVVRVLRGGNAEDTRSDNEEEEEEEELPIKAGVDAEKLQFPKKYPSGGRGTSSVFQSPRVTSISKDRKGYLDRIGCEQRISR